jgi:hypothetical protein
MKDCSMKSRTPLIIIGILIVVASGLSSCKTTRITAVKCPEFVEKNNHKVATKLNRNKKMKLAIRQRARGRKQHIGQLNTSPVPVLYYHSLSHLSDRRL